MSLEMDVSSLNFIFNDYVIIIGTFTSISFRTGEVFCVLNGLFGSYDIITIGNWYLFIFISLLSVGLFMNIFKNLLFICSAFLLHNFCCAISNDQIQVISGEARVQCLCSGWFLFVRTDRGYFLASMMDPR